MCVLECVCHVAKKETAGKKDEKKLNIADQP